MNNLRVIQKIPCIICGEISVPLFCERLMVFVVDEGRRWDVCDDCIQLEIEKIEDERTRDFARDCMEGKLPTKCVIILNRGGENI